MHFNELAFYRVMKSMWGQNIVKTRFDDNDRLIGLTNRLKTTTRKEFLESKFTHNLQPFLFATKTKINGAINTVSSSGGARIDISASDGSKFTYQTKEYFHYVPGTVAVSDFGIRFGSPQTNIIRRTGLYDDRDGFFFEQDSVGMKVVRRSSYTGNPIDYSTRQSAWNIDSMNGRGLSGINIDWTKIQMPGIEYSWYGAGMCVYCITVGGRKYPVHKEEAGNNLTEPLCGNPDLPFRYTIEAVGIPSATGSMMVYGATVGREDGGDLTNLDLAIAASNGTGSIAIGSSRRPILSVRTKLFASDGTINRGAIKVKSYSIQTDSVNIFYEVVYSGSLNGANWINIDNQSFSQYDTQSSQITGGVVIASGYIGANAQAGGSKTTVDVNLTSRFPIITDFDGSTSIPLTIVATSLGAATNCRADIEWAELD